MVQVPAASVLMVVPFAEQTAGVAEVKVTARPELADRFGLKIVPTDCVPMALNVIVCEA